MKKCSNKKIIGWIMIILGSAPTILIGFLICGMNFKWGIFCLLLYQFLSVIGVTLIYWDSEIERRSEKLNDKKRNI